MGTETRGTSGNARVPSLTLLEGLGYSHTTQSLITMSKLEKIVALPADALELLGAMGYQELADF